MLKARPGSAGRFFYFFEGIVLAPSPVLPDQYPPKASGNYNGPARFLPKWNFSTGYALEHLLTFHHGSAFETHLNLIQ